jgi:hypothetical protein
MFIKSTLAGGAILFAWQFISWSLLPFRNAVLQSFRDESAVAASVVANAPRSGVYVLPLSRDMSSEPPEQAKAAEKRALQGPLVFASIRIGGMKPMGFYLVVQFITQLVNAFLLSIVLTQTKVRSYGGRVLFIFTLALLAGVAGHVPNWNWFNFSTSYTALEISDLLVGWTLAGLVIAKIID